MATVFFSRPKVLTITKLCKPGWELVAQAICDTGNGRKATRQIDPPWLAGARKYWLGWHGWLDGHLAEKVPDTDNDQRRSNISAEIRDFTLHFGFFSRMRFFCAMLGEDAKNAVSFHDQVA